VFTDPRALGKVHVHTATEVEGMLTDFGPEPLPEAFTAEWFHAEAKRSRLSAKLFPMGQRRIAGLGKHLCGGSAVPRTNSSPPDDGSLDSPPLVGAPRRDCSSSLRGGRVGV
jgi:hypothetical protein